MPVQKPCKNRWYILLVFFYYAFINLAQMTTYSSITDIVARYYQVSTFSVNWTSLLYTVLYPVFAIPASYIVERKNLRVACLYGCLGTALGTTLKVFSIARDRFWVVILGQVLTAASVTLIMCLPPKIAAVWFQPNEVSMACSLGTLGTNLGNAFGYLLAVSVVPDSQDLTEVREGIKVLCWSLAALMVPVSLSVIFYFPAAPPQLQHSNITNLNNNICFWKGINFSKGFILHTLAYAINVGVFTTIMILLSEFVTAHFENAAEDAGWMGFCLLIFGVIGCIVFGYYLDKTHKYKESCIFLYATTTLCIAGLIGALQSRSIASSYLICCLLGIVVNPYIPVGFEFGIELTYPSDEGTIASVLFASSQIASSIFAIGAAQINSYFGPKVALTTLVVLMVVGTLTETLVPNKLERQRCILVKSGDEEISEER